MPAAGNSFVLEMDPSFNLIATPCLSQGLLLLQRNTVTEEQAGEERVYVA